MYIVDSGILYTTTEKEYRRYLRDFIANDGVASLGRELIGKVKDITNLTVSRAKYEDLV